MNPFQMRRIALQRAKANISQPKTKEELKRQIEANKSKLHEDNENDDVTLPKVKHLLKRQIQERFRRT
jgi:hypothetical protein